jgi:hypothetical protein
LVVGHSVCLAMALDVKISAFPIEICMYMREELA